MDRRTTHSSGDSSIDTSLIRDIYCGPEVLLETCVAMKFVDDDDDGSVCLTLVIKLCIHIIYGGGVVLPHILSFSKTGQKCFKYITLK